MPRISVTQPKPTAREPRCLKFWAALGLGLVAVFLLAGCRARPLSSAPQADAVRPAATATPTRKPVPTITFPSVPAPTLIPLFTPRGAAASDREDEPGEAVQAPGESGLRPTFVGTYARQEAEHSEGQVHLAVQGPAVYATFQATRLPVQPYVLEQAAVLFTVPEGYRPATTITWEVNSQLVRSDGKPDPRPTGCPGLSHARGHRGAGALCG